MNKLFITIFFLFSFSLANSQEWYRFDQSNSNMVNAYNYTLAVDSSNTLWIGHSGFNSGISSFSNFKNFTYYGGPSYPDFDYNGHTTITVDDSNNVWTYGKYYGLIKFDGVTTKLYDEADYGFIYGTSKIIKDTNGYDIYGIAYRVFKYDSKNDTIIEVQINLQLTSFKDIALDKNNNIWIATGDSGIAKFDGANVTCYNAYKGTPGDAGNYFEKIAYDKKNDVFWLSTGGAGVYKFDGTSFTRYSTWNSNIGSNDISALAVDSNGNVLVGLKLNGFAYFDGTNWYNFLGTADPYFKKQIWDITVDKNQNFIGAYWGGLYIFKKGGIVGIEKYQQQPEKNYEYYYKNTTHELVFNFKELSSVESIKIMDIHGKTILESEINKVNLLNYSLPINNSSKGVYLFSIQLNNQTYSNKFIITH